MSKIHKAIVLALIGAASLATSDAASARHLRRHRYSHHTPHQFVFKTPEQAAIVSAAGEFGGSFGTGILGPSTADPYERPGYGYNGHGYYGPGFGYPGF